MHGFTGGERTVTCIRYSRSAAYACQYADHRTYVSYGVNPLQSEHHTIAPSQRLPKPCNDLIVVKTNKMMWQVSYSAVMRRTEGNIVDAQRRGTALCHVDHRQRAVSVIPLSVRGRAAKAIMAMRSSQMLLPMK